MHRHPAVQLAAAVGRPDLHAGELPVAYVQLRAGLSATEDEPAVIRQGGDHRTRSDTEGDQVGGSHAPHRCRQDLQTSAQAARDRRCAARCAAGRGAPISRLEVINDPRFGIQIEVTVASRATVEVAREILGQFAFRFEVS
jgi:fatty-acyl-CoA synthase